LQVLLRVVDLNKRAGVAIGQPGCAIPDATLLIRRLVFPIFDREVNSLPTMTDSHSPQAAIFHHFSVAHDCANLLD